MPNLRRYYYLLLIVCYFNATEISRETWEGWPLMSIKIEANGDSYSTCEGVLPILPGPSFIVINRLLWNL
jgi:hypothetical protein